MGKPFFLLRKPLGYYFYKLMPDHLQRVTEYDYRLDSFQFKHFGVRDDSVAEHGDVRDLEL